MYRHIAKIVECVMVKKKKNDFINTVLLNIIVLLLTTIVGIGIIVVESAYDKSFVIFSIYG